MATVAASCSRIPLNTFAIAFGLAGLAETWSAVEEAESWPPGIGTVCWLGTAVAWCWLIIAHLVRGIRSSDRLVDQLRHAAQGPIAALVPVTAMLLGGELNAFAPAVGTTVVVVAIIVAMVFAGWLIGSWFEGRLQLSAVHGGYLLPTVAAGLIAADTAAHVGLTSLGWAMFGIGSFFWAVMTTLLMLRLTVSPSLPAPLVPTMAILIAPPAVAGIAWFALTGNDAGPVSMTLGGLTGLNVLVQIALVGWYRKLPFSLGFWSFTFPTAAVVAYTIMWLAIARPAGWTAFTITLAAALTALIGAIGVKSLMLIDHRSGTRAAETTIRRANDLDSRGADQNR